MTLRAASLIIPGYRVGDRVRVVREVTPGFIFGDAGTVLRVGVHALNVHGIAVAAVSVDFANVGVIRVPIDAVEYA